ncbi:MAG TPA: hypothetical protein VE954_27485 [Oligoflexus sp.]|uniref:hypothetical protein n=1 Tax=Oligoflexus sp. TaxID=1971216 RepID=UPI002D72769C|nr:hypothetical protein [Oligoflexus sp.]HYX36868.1 hypothetical protein [Oligoflexus sp.]
MREIPRFAAYFCLALLAPLGCAKNKDEDAPEAPQPRVLSLAAFYAPTYADLPWEEKCSGTMQFFKDFQKEYLPDSEVSFSDRTCKRELEVEDTYINVIEVAYSRNGQKLNLETHLQAVFDSRKLNLIPDQVTFNRRISGNDLPVFRYDPVDANIGSNLLNIAETFDAWLNKEPDGPIKIYGYPYPEFLALIQERFGPESTGLELTSPKVTFKLIPSSENAGSGTVEFTSADLSTYPAGTLLGCSDLPCLQASGITFKVAGPSLALVGPATEEGSDNGIPVKVRPGFRVYLDFLKKR